MATREELTARIAAQGEQVRELKAGKAGKEQVDAAVAALLALKGEFKAATGEDFGPPAKPKKEKKEKKEAAAEAPKDPSKKSKKELNKERKKAQKQAIKSGAEPEAKPAAAAAAVAVAAPAAKAPQVAETAVPPAAKVTPVSLPTPTTEDGAVVFSSAAQLPRAAFVVAQLARFAGVFTNTDAKDLAPTLTLPDGRVVSGDFAVARYLTCIAAASTAGLYGADSDAVARSQVDAWLDFALTKLSVKNPSGLALLDAIVQHQTFLVGYALSLADIGVWASLAAAADANKAVLAPFPNVSRWFAHLNSQEPFASAAHKLRALPVARSKTTDHNPTTSTHKGKSSGSCPPLKDAVEGQVVTRFPPEPSGYLHIGHIKACMLNHYYARHYNGKLLVRFDDTNPSKEKDEFEQSILSDLARLDIVPDAVSYTSDFFPKIQELARQIIRDGKAYMDNTPQEQMREERMHGIPSKCRDQTPEENMALFEKMLKNDPSVEGYCLRGKIDMQAKNKTLRDPVFYRINLTPHHRTGTKYLAYPTYDFACPIVDSLEGVTHALRTTEYNDRDAQYQWVLQALGLRIVHIHGFARMNFVHSVLSKRKLQWFVDNGHVESWADPRFPTVQGVLRRGVQVEALREFILSQGASRRITDMEWDKFWTLNKRVIDPIARRYFAIADAVPVELTNVSADEVVGVPVPRHPKDASMGNKIMRFGRNLVLERDDVELFTEGEEVTLMRLGNIRVTKLVKDAAGKVVKVEAENFPEGDFKKTKYKVAWLADVPDLVPCTLVEFDHLISKPKLEEGDDFHDHLTPVTRAEMFARGDHELRNAQVGDVVQLERRGFFRVDSPYLSADKPLVLFMVPDGKVKSMSTLSTKLAHR